MSLQKIANVQILRALEQLTADFNIVRDAIANTPMGHNDLRRVMRKLDADCHWSAGEKRAFDNFMADLGWNGDDDDFGTYLAMECDLDSERVESINSIVPNLLEDIKYFGECLAEAQADVSEVSL